MVELVSKTIYDLFCETVARQPNRQAIGTVQNDAVQNGAVRWLTWQEVADRVAKEQLRLQAEGCGPRSGVSAVDANSFDWVVRNLAAWGLDAVLLTADHSFAAEVKFPADVAAVVNTSGTGGEPRSVLLTHENLTSNTIAVSEVSKQVKDENDELRLSFLPFSHLYARTCDLYTWIHRGSKLVLSESRDTLFDDCRSVQPTVINGVPYFFQKAIGLAEAESVSLQNLLGGHVRRCYAGGAALSPAVEDRFFDEGIPLYNGYGLTESSPVITISTPDAFKRGTVGRPLPGVEVRIERDRKVANEKPHDEPYEGELLVRGPNVMLGYANRLGQVDKELTSTIIQEGWLHTGDLGSIDSEGYLTITGRRKEVIALSTGKKVSPSQVEALLCASPWIEQAAVFGEGQKGLVALLVPNPERLRAEICRRKLWVWSKRRAVNHPQICKHYEAVLNECIATMPKECQLHGFTILLRPFSQPLGELTKKLSLRRGVIAKSFAKELRQANV